MCNVAGVYLGEKKKFILEFFFKFFFFLLIIEEVEGIIFVHGSSLGGHPRRRPSVKKKTFDML